MRRFALLAAGLVLSVFAGEAVAQFAPAKKQPAGGAQLATSGSHRWEVGVRIRAVGGPCAGLYGTVPVPNDWPEQQVKIVNEDISRHVRRVSYRTIDGVKQMLFDVPLLPTGETASAVITFEVTKSALTPPDDTSGFVVPTKLPSDLRKYLGPSPNIESTHPKIKKFAKELTEGKEGGWAEVEAIYDGVREKVKVENEKLKGAADTLNDGKGRYEDVTGLFVACCRSRKIPARMVYVPDDSYAEFYLEDSDGQGHWFPCNVAATEKEFGAIKDQKPILQKGDNIRVPEKKEPQGFVAEFLTGKGNTGGRPEVEFIRRLEPAM